MLNFYLMIVIEIRKALIQVGLKVSVALHLTSSRISWHDHLWDFSDYLEAFELMPHLWSDSFSASSMQLVLLLVQESL